MTAVVEVLDRVEMKEKWTGVSSVRVSRGHTEYCKRRPFRVDGPVFNMQQKRHTGYGELCSFPFPLADALCYNIRYLYDDASPAD